MKVNYNKLWKLLIDNNMKKMDLLNAAKLSTNTLSKLSKNEIVSTEILIRISKFFKCGIDDIMEIKEDI